MNTLLHKIINELKAEGKDYANFKILLAKIKESKIDINKDDIVDLVINDPRIRLHTTPNSIAQLIAQISQRNKPQNAIDICCGIGNNLYYLQNSIESLTGVEIIENIAALTAYLIPDIKIITADSLMYPFSEKYDLVVGNIPWGMKVEYKGKRIYGEEAFIRKALEICNENGEIILLVPYSVLKGSQFKKLRYDFHDHLVEIIAIPPGAIRNIEVKTAIILIRPKKSIYITITQLTKFEFLTEEYLEKAKSKIPSKNLIERWDPEFHLLKENSFYTELKSTNTVPLNQLAEVINGNYIPKENLLDSGQLLYLKPVHLQGDGINSNKYLKYISTDQLYDFDYKYIIQPGDIIISTIINDLNIYVYSANDTPAFASNNIAIIRSSEQDYILSYLKTSEGKRIFKTQAEDLKIGQILPQLKIKDLQEIRIPVLPISELNIIGNKSIEKASKKELEDYLEIIKSVKPESSNTVNEPLSIYAEKQSDVTILIAFIEDRFKRIESRLSIVNEKLDKLLNIIIQLKSEFDIVRNLPRNEEEKVFKLCQKIDARLDKIYNEEKATIDNYIDEVKRWLDLWDLLDIQSQKFLPTAEFIFDELSRMPEADFAPFIVQYCRTLENEILKKLFETYHSSGLSGIDRNELVKNDLENTKTGKFALMVKNNRQSYTLGDMNFIMALLKHDGDTLKKSLLLQHFREFTIKYFDECIIQSNFLKDINMLTSDFRNKAAHPYSISLEMAKQCQELLRKSLNIFLESIKNR